MSYNSFSSYFEKFETYHYCLNFATDFEKNLSSVCFINERVFLLELINGHWAIFWGQINVGNIK